MSATTQSDSKDIKDVKDRKRRRPIKTEKTGDPAPEPSPEGSQKKTRTVTAAPTSAGAEIDKVKRSRALFYYEENEVDNRSPERDLELHEAASDELRRVMAEISQLKDSDDSDKAEKIEQLRIHGTLQFVTLRRLNRMAHFRCKKAKDKTNEAKQYIDTQNLRLQNLLYEVMHLQKEISKCLEFKSKDEDINLVPVEEFYKNAPDTISRPEITTGDPHQQTLARLEWELEQRKRLSEQLKEASGHKDVIVQETKTKEEYLESLQPKLNTILQSTKPVQEYLGMPFDEIREQQMTAMYLPQPLYVLYMQSSAYKDACDKYMSVSIQGDVDVAKSMESTTVDLDDDSDSDNEEQDKLRERRRRTTADDKTLEKKTKILKKHPLSVQVMVKCKDDSALELCFCYLVALGIVTVTVKLIPGPGVNTSSIAGGDLLSQNTILSCLYPGDTGDETPNSANNFALRKLGLANFKEYISEVGRPYHWAQWLCGLQFLNITDTSPKVQVSLSHSHMEGTIKRLRHRVRSRLSLQNQLAALERGQVVVSADYQALFPTKITSKLVNWKRSIKEDFCALPYTQGVVSAGLALDSDMYFTGLIERGSAKLTIQACVSQDYPDVPPLFALSLNWKHERHNQNDDNIRQMEGELNIYYSDLASGKSRDQLLTNQIERLMMCLDVYLETESDATGKEGPAEFSREKIFPRIARGPDRSKPYKFNPQLGFFSHR